MSFVPPDRRKPTIWSQFSSFLSTLNPLQNKQKFRSHTEKARHLEMRRFRMKVFTIAAIVGIYSGIQIMRHYFGSEESRLQELGRNILKQDQEELELLRGELERLKGGADGRYNYRAAGERAFVNGTNKEAV